MAARLLEAEGSSGGGFTKERRADAVRETRRPLPQDKFAGTPTFPTHTGSGPHK